MTTYSSFGMVKLSRTIFGFFTLAGLATLAGFTVLMACFKGAAFLGTAAFLTATDALVLRGATFLSTTFFGEVAGDFLAVVV